MNKQRKSKIAERPPSAIVEPQRAGSASQEIGRLRELAQHNLGVTREDIIQMFIDAGNLAKATGEASSIVAAAKELGKMLGYYAVEVKKTLHGVDKNDLKKLLDEMTDEELHRLANAKVIDGEFKRIPAPDNVQN